jgi:hypothetical protein
MPRVIAGVAEYPVSFFQDYPGHFRHTQVCACSSHEMTAALELAFGGGWSDFVIVLHTFEMVKNRHTGEPRSNGVVKNRFERLCRFLGSNKDRFETQYTPAGPPPELKADTEGITTPRWLAVHRYAEQVWSRIA